MQPLVISTSFSSVRERFAPPSRTKSASMFTSLMSLTITATFRPCRLLRTWFSKVVFPAPRKPDRTVTGSFCMEVKKPLKVRGFLFSTGHRCRYVMLYHNIVEPTACCQGQGSASSNHVLGHGRVRSWPRRLGTRLRFLVAHSLSVCEIHDGLQIATAAVTHGNRAERRDRL